MTRIKSQELAVEQNEAQTPCQAERAGEIEEVQNKLRQPYNAFVKMQADRFGVFLESAGRSVLAKATTSDDSNPSVTLVQYGSNALSDPRAQNGACFLIVMCSSNYCFFLILSVLFIGSQPYWLTVFKW